MIEIVRTWRLLQALRAGVRASPESLAALQTRLLRSTLDHAYEHVPHYRRLWDERGVSPGEIRGLTDLSRLPMTTQAMLRDGLASGHILAEGAVPIGTFPSSGTSGRPLAVPRGLLEQRLWRALALRMWLEHGHRWWHVTAHLDAKRAPSHALRWLGIARTAWISTDLPVEAQVRELARARAATWVGTPTVLGRIVEAAGDLLTRRPRLVVSQGEVLDSGTRGLIREQVGSDPVDVYGLTEVGYVAWQCDRRDGLHVNADAFLVEVLRDGQPARPGELGSVVVTDLRGRTMPLIRYDTGDLAVAASGPCPCGSTLPLIRTIEGRARDAVTLADGRVLTTRAVVDHLAGLLLPTRYVLRQESVARFRLQLDPASAGEREAARSRVSELVGGAEVELEIGLPPAVGDPAKARPLSSSLGLKPSRPGTLARRAHSPSRPGP